jgi:hypothetical protein
MKAGDDHGSALVEFIAFGVALMIPVAYLGLCVGHLHAAAYATSLAARESARSFATSPAVPQARAAALASAQLAFIDHGVDYPEGALTVTCEGTCLAPGSAVVTEVSWQVPLPWLSEIVVPVTARHVEPVDDYRSGTASWAHA